MKMSLPEIVAKPGASLSVVEAGGPHDEELWEHNYAGMARHESPGHTCNADAVLLVVRHSWRRRVLPEGHHWALRFRPAAFLPPPRNPRSHLGAAK